MKLFYLIAFFFISASAAAYFDIWPHKDEMHYRDGAKIMRQDQEWLIPKTKEGHLRFTKPLLTYWAVALGYSMFGENSFGARVPGILTGCLSILLTYILACDVSRSKHVGFIAALMLACVPVFFTSSIQAKPDVYLTFCFLVSFAGFVRLIVLDQKVLGSFCMAYGGAAGAVMSKGLLGIGVVLFAWTFVFIQTGSMVGVRKVIHVPSIIAAFLPVFAWFSNVYVNFFSVASSFHNDQVVKRIILFDKRILLVPVNVAVYSAMLMVAFLPWTLLILRIAIKNGSALFKANADLKFLAFAVMAFIMFFSLGLPVSILYARPILPVIAIIYATLLCRHRDEFTPDGVPPIN